MSCNSTPAKNEFVVEVTVGKTTLPEKPTGDRVVPVASSPSGVKVGDDILYLGDAHVLNPYLFGVGIRASCVVLKCESK